MWEIAVPLLLLVAYIIYEFRIRKPDQFILYEKGNRIRIRSARFYPRHFSLAVPRQALTGNLKFEAEARGRLALEVKIVLSAAPAEEHLDALIRSGGWNKDASSKAMEQARVVIESLSRNLCARHDVETLFSDLLNEHLRKEAAKPLLQLGLQLVAINTQSIEPLDRDIVVAMQKQEEARIREQTEKNEQKVRIALARMRVEAEEKILKDEQSLALRKLEMKQDLDKQEAALADQRVREELARKKQQLDFEKEEMALLKNHPELLMLSPQITQLAKASQKLPNAKTVVSLSPENNAGAGDLLTTLQNLVTNILSGSGRSSDK